MSLSCLLRLILQPRHRDSIGSSSSHDGEEDECVSLSGFSFKTIISNKWTNTSWALDETFWSWLVSDWCQSFGFTQHLAERCFLESCEEDEEEKVHLELKMLALTWCWDTKLTFTNLSDSDTWKIAVSRGVLENICFFFLNIGGHN